MHSVTLPTKRDIAYVLAMAVACWVSYQLMTRSLRPFVGHDDILLGGMWAVVATVFVFKERRQESVEAGLLRLLATCVSFALCLVYLLWLPFTPSGLAVLLALGALIMIALGRHDDIVTTGITTAVVMVVAGLSPHEAWREPLLRLVDTIVGVFVGVFFRMIATGLLRLMPGTGAATPHSQNRAEKENGDSNG